MNIMIHVDISVQKIINTIIFMILIGIFLFIFNDYKNKKIPKLIERILILFAYIVIFIFIILNKQTLFCFR